MIHFLLGDTLKLTCHSDESYEFCKLKHNSMEVSKFEWIYKKKVVEMKSCHARFANRMSFIGDYSNNECAVELKDISEADSGIWECEMEKYVFGIVRGPIDKVYFNINVEGSMYSYNSFHISFCILFLCKLPFFR